jgi:hypothetical protein
MPYQCSDEITSSFFLKKNYLIWKKIVLILGLFGSQKLKNTEGPLPKTFS